MSEVRKTVAVCMPGTPFDARWLAEFWNTLAWLLSQFDVRPAFATGNNIYQVREAAYEVVRAIFPETPDYVLWIDSDNPPRRSSVEWLFAALEDPRAAGLVDIVSGWYRMSDARGLIAAGGMGSLYKEAAIVEAQKYEALMEAECGVGFGLLLMRGSVLVRLGARAFWPAYVEGRERPLTDDWSWCHCAREAGYRLWLHPMAFVPHLKLLEVPAPAGSQEKGEKTHGDNSNGWCEPSNLQELDAHKG